MQKEIVEYREMKLIGLKTRTCNADEFKPETAKLGAIVGRYWQEKIAEKIPNRKNPGITLVGYFNYASDEYGEYDYLMGEQVTSLDEIPEGLTGLVVPAGQYLRITSATGKIPQIIAETWQQVWQATINKELGGQRKYQVDFEIYDQRASNPAAAVFDIYLGILVVFK